MGVRVRGAGGQLPSQIQTKQWGKFGQINPSAHLNQRVPIRPCSIQLTNAIYRPTINHVTFQTNTYLLMAHVRLTSIKRHHN